MAWQMSTRTVRVARFEERADQWIRAFEAIEFLDQPEQVFRLTPMGLTTPTLHHHQPLTSPGETHVKHVGVVAAEFVALVF